MLTTVLYSHHHRGIVVESFVVIACRAWIGEKTEALGRPIVAPFVVAPLRLVAFRDALVLEPLLSLRMILPVMASKHRRHAVVGSTESQQEIDPWVGRAYSVEMADLVVAGEAADDEAAIEGALARFYL